MLHPPDDPHPFGSGQLAIGALLYDHQGVCLERAGAGQLRKYFLQSRLSIWRVGGEKGLALQAPPGAAPPTPHPGAVFPTAPPPPRLPPPPPPRPPHPDPTPPPA